MAVSSHKHLTMLRSFRLPDLLTFANTGCGMLAIFFCLNYLDSEKRDPIGMVFLLLPLALVFDVLDGVVARWLTSKAKFAIAKAFPFRPT